MSDAEQWDMVDTSDSKSDTSISSQGLLEKHGIVIQDDLEPQIEKFQPRIRKVSHIKRYSSVGIQTDVCHSNFIPTRKRVQSEPIDFAPVIPVSKKQLPITLTQARDTKEKDIDSLVDDKNKNTVNKSKTRVVIDTLHQITTRADIVVAGFFTMLGWTMVMFIDEMYALDMNDHL